MSVAGSVEHFYARTQQACVEVQWHASDKRRMAEERVVTGKTAMVTPTVPSTRLATVPSGVTALLAAIVESSEDAILATTMQGVITAWNPAAERTYGYSREEVLGLPVDLILPIERSREVARSSAGWGRVSGSSAVNPFGAQGWALLVVGGASSVSDRRVELLAGA